jgi:hypothetical protein
MFAAALRPRPSRQTCCGAASTFGMDHVTQRNKYNKTKQLESNIGQQTLIRFGARAVAMELMV